MKHKPLTEAAAPLDPIASLHAAIIAASEQSWEWHGVSHDERARLRPGVATMAREATSRLRAEHAARSGGQP